MSLKFYGSAEVNLLPEYEDLAKGISSLYYWSRQHENPNIIHEEGFITVTWFCNDNYPLRVRNWIDSFNSLNHFVYGNTAGIVRLICPSRAQLIVKLIGSDDQIASGLVEEIRMTTNTLSLHNPRYLVMNAVRRFANEST